MTNDYMFRAVLQSDNKVLRGLICSLLHLAESEVSAVGENVDYREARPAVPISFLDYTLFEDCPEFYASYKLINVKNQQIYSDNLTLYVMDLSCIDLATDERKEHENEMGRLRAEIERLKGCLYNNCEEKAESK